MSDRHDFETQMVILLPRLRRFSIKLTHSVEEGEDLLQAACLKALERWRQWDAGTHLDSWIYRIIQTTWIDRCKSATFRLVDFDTVAAGRASDRLTTPTIEQELEQRWKLRRAQSAIDSLTPDQRDVVRLVIGEGMSYQETARELRIPIGTVMSRLARARWSLGRQVRQADKHSAVQDAVG